MSSSITNAALMTPAYEAPKAETSVTAEQVKAGGGKIVKNTPEAKAKTVDAAVYKKSKETPKNKEPYKINKMNKEDRAALVEQLKRDQESRKAQLVNLVSKMMTGQGKAAAIANGGTDLTSKLLGGKSDNENDIWRFLAKGNFTVDAATKKQAMEDISEKGYWGVEQTSKRMFDFASALAGDDVEKMKEMQKAMEKGYKEATKAWGQKLPEISKKTLDAANKLFEDYYTSKKTSKSA